MKLIDELSSKRAALDFASSMIDRVVLMKVIKKSEAGYVLKPVMDIGDASGYGFYLGKNKCFFNEEFFINDTVNVVCKGFNKKKKIVHVIRFDEQICELEFSRIFENMVEIVEENYSYKRVHFKLDYRSRRVVSFLDWKSKPSSFFISKLNRELEKKFGRWKIPIKINNRDKESDDE